MQDVNEIIQDQIIHHHAVDLMKIEKGQRQKILKYLKVLERDLVMDLLDHDPTTPKKTALQLKRLKALLKQTKKTIKSHMGKITDMAMSDLYDVAEIESAWALGSMDAALGMSVSSVALSENRLKAIVGRTIVEGKYPKEWWSKQAPTLQDKFLREMRIGMGRSETTGQLVNRVRNKVMSVSRRNATALVRTSTAAVVMEAKMESYNQIKDILKGYKYVATLDTRTTPICRALDGALFDINYKVIKGPKWGSPPPNHWNCRSTITPRTKSWAELKKQFKGIKSKKLDAIPSTTRAAMGGKVPRNMDYNKWLRNQSHDLQNKILGPTRANLFRDGKITNMTQLLDQEGDLLTLPELRKNIIAGTLLEPITGTLIPGELSDSGAKAAKKIQKKKITDAEKQVEKERLNFIADLNNKNKTNIFIKETNTHGQFKSVKKPVINLSSIFEPEFKSIAGKSKSAGAILYDESRDKVWIFEPKNHFGGYEHSFPKGGIESLTYQQTALKEIYEETGLQGQLLDFLGDYEKSTTNTRYYIGKVIKGNPTEFEWESQSVKLVPVDRLKSFLNKQIDKIIADDFLAVLEKMKKQGGSIEANFIKNNVKLQKEIENKAWFNIMEKNKDDYIGAMAIDNVIKNTDVSVGPIDKIKLFNKEFNKITNYFANKYQQLIMDIPANDFDKVMKMAGENNIVVWKKLNIKEKIDKIKDAIKKLDGIKYGKIKKEFNDILINVMASDNKDTILSLAKTHSLGWEKKSIADKIKSLKKAIEDAGYKKRIEVLFADDPPGIKAIQSKIDKYNELNWKDKYEAISKVLHDKNIAEIFVKQENSKYFIEAIKDSAWEKSSMDEKLLIFNKVKDNMVEKELKIAVTKMEEDKYFQDVVRKIGNSKWNQLSMEDKINYFNTEKTKIIKKKALDELKAAKKERYNIDFEIVGPVDDSILDFKKYEKYKDQIGSNIGGFYRGKDNAAEKWYFKFPGEDAVRNELLAGKLYEKAGVYVPEMTIVKDGEKIGIASRIVDGVEKNFDKLKSGLFPHDIEENFIVDAWLANWDVVGTGADNMLVIGNRIIRIDTGGALRYRAMGSLKGKSWNNLVNEIDTIRESGWGKPVFGKVTQSQMEIGARKVLKISNNEIKQIVRNYGPISKVEQEDMIKKLIARKEVIRKRFPGATIKKEKSLPIKSDNIIKDKYEKIENSRINGFAIRSDKDQIEDTQILFWTEKDVDGKFVTNSIFKLRGEGVKIIEDTIILSDKLSKSISVEDVRNKFVTALAGIAKQAREGNLLRQTDINRAIEALETYSKKINKMRDLVDSKKLFKKEIVLFEKKFKPWKKYLDKVIDLGYSVKYDFKYKDYHSSNFFANLEHGPINLRQIKSKSKFNWKKKKDTWNKKVLINSNAKRTGKNLILRDSGIKQYTYYETEIGKATIRYWDSTAPRALRNRIEVFAKGKSKIGTKNIYKALDKIGIDTSLTTSEYQEELYLIQLFYLRNNPDEFKKVMEGLAGVSNPVKRVEFLKNRYDNVVGFKATGSKYYNPFGEYQAFGNGRIINKRPDLPLQKEWTEFSKNHLLRHTNTSGNSMYNSLKAILNSGGNMVSTTEKLRYGFEWGGKSPASDIESGGANYFFTRIRKKENSKKIGYYWKADVLRRTDAITYPRDNFGRTTELVINSYRKSNIEDYIKIAEYLGSDETIFKNSLSLFDDLEKIVVDENERDKIINLFKDKLGSDYWPDGRKIEEVILTF